MYQDALSHFKKSDPILYSIAKRFEILDLEPKKVDLFFLSLVEEIVSQQLSIKVADIIFARLINLNPEEPLTPEFILQTSDETLRAVGLSYSKVKYIKDLSAKVSSGELDLGNLVNLSDQGVIDELIKVKGIGQWTAEMFLMFALGREDVFSFGDLGLKNGLKKLYQLDSPTNEELERLIEKWKPYRTYAARILWRSLD